MEIIRMLSKYRSKIGDAALMFFTLAAAALVFSEKDKEFRKFLGYTAGILFALGMLIALARMLSTIFSHRPARGMVDGLAAGLLAGLIGGYFGYGFHTVSHLQGFLDQPYYEPWYERVALCILYAIPIGGLIGLVCDLAHPDRQIAWRRYVSVFILAGAFLLAIAGSGVAVFAPEVRGAGIDLSDIQLIFETFALAFAIIVTSSFGWSFRKFMAHLPVMLMIIGVGRLMTFAFPSFDSDVAKAGGKLYETGFFHTESTSPAERLSGHWQLWMTQVVITISICFLGTVTCYFAFFKDHRLNKWIESKVRA